MTQYLHQQVQGGVAHLELDDPKTLNALHPDMAAQLRRAFEECAVRDDVRAIVLSGRGAHFSAGGNLQAAQQASASAGAAAAFMETFNGMVRAAWRCPQPLVAVAKGTVAGGALGLLLCADTIFLGHSARLLQAFVHIGLVPDCGTSLLLAQRVGAARAAELSFSGRTVGAEEAQALGLGEFLLADDRVAAEAHAWAQTLAGKSPEALRLTKSLLRAAQGDALEAALVREGGVQQDLLQTEAFRERVGAFLRRKPA